jgi:hypothetical protein
VVVGSPLKGIAMYERQYDIPSNFINLSMYASVVAVLFILSPLYFAPLSGPERRKSDSDSLSRCRARRGRGGAFQRLERNEMVLGDDFYEAFERDLNDAENVKVRFRSSLERWEPH